MALGLTSVTFRKLSADEIILLAYRAGCEVIEWGGDIHVTNKAQALDVRRKCRDKGIGINSYGSYFRIGQGEPNEFEFLCEITKTLGAKVIRVWLGDKGSSNTDREQFENLAARVETLADTAKKFGLIIAFEFHKGTYNDTCESSLRFLRKVGRDNVKTYWQPFFAGRDIKNLKGVIENTAIVHMFNWSRLGARYSLERGEKKIKEFLSILKANEYTGDIILEFVKGDNPKNFLNDFSYLKQWYTNV